MQGTLNQIDQDILEFTNKIRANPKEMIPHLEKILATFEGDVMYIDGQIGIQTNEGPAAVQEAIEFAKTAAPVGTLTWNDQLARCSQDHVEDIGPKGLTQHESSKGEGLMAKVSKHFQVNGMVGENLSFGQSSGIDVVLQLVIDDGVASRGHRNNIFQSKFGKLGCFSGQHSGYETMTCLVYAS
ncbi:UNKNOWN [Stylonychia lemnae]|uniref:SCP domain-containing protein n=1 Tax=Stylonychia lemnae TaxID=5949 RepID=A0A078B5Z8_STYLE|nr:UNKNOWN [Stylonychia lemnae]|eukprot:CDW89935.1 UNKNOWN [Stylonychia lemnae]